MDKEIEERHDLEELFDRYLNGENPPLWIEDDTHIALRPEQASVLREHLQRAKEGVESRTGLIETFLALQGERENELDLKAYEEAMEEYRANPTTYTAEEIAAKYL